MSQKKQLDTEQLEKVSGGLGEKHTIVFTISFYNAEGKKEEQDVVIEYTGTKSAVTEATLCEKWCTDKNYEYIAHKEKSAPSGQIVA